MVDSKTWGVGAVVLADGRFFGFPHERPAVPKRDIAEARGLFKKAHTGPKPFGNEDYVSVIVSALLGCVKELVEKHGGRLPHPHSEEVYDLSRSIMMLTQVSGHRYWLVTEGRPRTTFQPVSASSPQMAMLAIERLIDERASTIH